ncbi:MAG: LacI family DNA-binding transcriptional regulator [Flavobacteriaceae bacterium]|nr:LacI family DNA-binding transcriptional regulator [Flavobacteriaceae bacterium]
MSKPTLKKIAERLNLSVGTVSKAIKDYPDISDKTKEKVKAVVEELSYKPNKFAQNLRNQESKIIGLIIPQIVHHFFSNIVLGVTEAAEKKGYLVIVLESTESYETEMKHLDLLIERHVDGLLLSLADNTIKYNHITEIIDQGVPIVLYDKISKSFDCHKVVIDDKKAAYNATKYLIDSGCKKIAHVRGPLKPQTTVDRFLGYKDALKDHHISFDKSIVFESEKISFDDGKEIAHRIKKNKNIDGVFAFTDLLASGILIGLVQEGVKIPEEISVMGFSNWRLTKMTSPSLSTVNQCGYEMGQKAFELLYEEIIAKKTNTKLKHKTIEIPTELVIRNSTKKPA